MKPKLTVYEIKSSCLEGERVLRYTVESGGGGTSYELGVDELDAFIKFKRDSYLADKFDIVLGGE